MSDKVPTPVSGNLDSKGAPDGVGDVPRKTDANGVHGRSAEGESGGGAYPNPHTGKTETNSGFMAHGGQTDIAYHGGGQAGDDGGNAPNGVAGSSGDTSEAGAEARATAPSTDADRKAHDISSDGGTIKVVETSGTAEAEATGKVGTDADYEREQKQPGSG
jgi:hypothetical protein